MRVLVTGATGRVGANLVRRLVRAGAGVRAMVMPGDPQAAKLDAWGAGPKGRGAGRAWRAGRALPEVEVAEASLTDQAAIDKACQGVTHVVHLAAQMVRGDTPVDRFFDINSLGTLRLLEGVVRAGGVERFVLTSTDGTYRPGDPPSVPLTEDTPQEPADYYGTAKLLGEVILRNQAAQFDIPYAMTRFATVLSPEEAAGLFTLRSMRVLLGRAGLGRDCNIWQLFRDHPNMAQILDEAAGDASDDTAVSLVGPGGPWSIHLVDVRDAVEGVYLALTEPGALGRAFNITAAEPTSYQEGAAVISEVFGVPKLTVEMPVTWRLEMAVDAARETLGYRPRHDYRDMVASAHATSQGDSDDYIPVQSR